jgi:hypothetical protein
VIPDRQLCRVGQSYLNHELHRAGQWSRTIRPAGGLSGANTIPPGGLVVLASLHATKIVQRQQR